MMQMFRYNKIDDLYQGILHGDVKFSREILNGDAKFCREFCMGMPTSLFSGEYHAKTLRGFQNLSGIIFGDSKFSGMPDPL